jgi:restriction endonuclease S subunit
VAEPYLDCPRAWRRASLEPEQDGGIILRVESGGTPSTSRAEHWDGEIPFLTPKDITGRTPTASPYVSRTERSITPSGLASAGSKLFAPGTVMLSKRAPVGAVAINAVPMATSQGFLNFTCGPRLRPLYLAYWFLANRPYLDLVANGSTYPELYRSDLFEFEIAVPPIEEQDGILAFLAALSLITYLGSFEATAASHNARSAFQHRRQRLAQLSEDVLPAVLSGKLAVPPAASLKTS